MKKATVSIILAIATLAVIFNQVFGFWAVVNGEEFWGQFYNYANVSQYEDDNDNPHFVFNFWVNEALANGNYETTFENGYIGTVNIMYNRVDDTYQIDEIVNVPMSVDMMDGNVYTQDEIYNELNHFANVMINVASVKSEWEQFGGLNGIEWQGFFDNGNYTLPELFSYSDSYESWVLNNNPVELTNTVFLPMVIK